MSPLFDAFEYAVAVLELLAAAARAGLVAAHLGRSADRTLRLGRGRRLHRRRLAAARRGGLRLRLARRATELCERSGLRVLQLQRAVQARAARLFLAREHLRCLD